MIMKRFSFTFVVRQIMLKNIHDLQSRRHFYSDANPYPPGRRGLRRNRNVWRSDSFELSHLELESTTPNNALEPTPVGAFSSAFAVDITGPAWLVCAPKLFSRRRGEPRNARRSRR